MKSLLLLAIALLSACDEKKDAGSSPVVPADFAKKHKPTFEAFRTKLDAAANLVKDLPAASVHVAKPEPPLVLMRATFIEGVNGFIYMGTDLPTLPEFGKYKGKEVTGGENGIGIVYSDFLDLESAYAMIEGREPRFSMTGGAADYLARKTAAMRYVIVGREVAYTAGTIDDAAREFTPGTFSGVAHLVDLNGPKHLGSVVFSATNSGSFESYKGSEKFMLQADLRLATVNAFIAEMKKVFPTVEMPELPK